MAETLALIAALLATVASFITLALGVFIASLAVRNALALARTRSRVRAHRVYDDPREAASRRDRVRLDWRQ